jgi:hypothetical protein
MRPPGDWRNHLEAELEKEELKGAAGELEPEPESNPNSLLGLVASYDSEEHHLEAKLEKEELKGAAGELEPEPEPNPNSLLGLVASYDSEEHATLNSGYLTESLQLKP